MSAVLAPLSLAAFTAGCWQIGAELEWTPALIAPDNPLSPWQVWVIASAVLLLLVTLLERYAQNEISPEHGAVES